MSPRVDSPQTPLRFAYRANQIRIPKLAAPTDKFQTTFLYTFYTLITNSSDSQHQHEV